MDTDSVAGVVGVAADYAVAVAVHVGMTAAVDDSIAYAAYIAASFVAVVVAGNVVLELEVYMYCTNSTHDHGGNSYYYYSLLLLLLDKS